MYRLQRHDFACDRICICIWIAALHAAPSGSLFGILLHLGAWGYQAAGSRLAGSGPGRSAAAP
jgi:hypothetical protein